MGAISTQDITTPQDLTDYYDSVGFSSNIANYGISLLQLVLVIPSFTFFLTLVSKNIGYRTFFVLFPFNIVLSANTFLVLLSIYVFESDFTDVVISIRDVFEMTDSMYYSFFGKMVGVMYIVSPFKHDSTDRRVLIFNRMAFVLLATLNIATIYSVGIDSVTINLGIPAVIYLLCLLLIGVVHIIGSYFLFWAAAVFIYFLGYRIKEFDIRLDATKAPENLGLEPYGTFVIKLLSLPFLALIITGWTGFIQPNILVYLLTICGSVLIPLAFVGSQYGLHTAIQRAKEERLRDLRESYAEDIDVHFSSKSLDFDSIDNSEARINSMLSVKNEIENLPEWPANINRLKQAGFGLFLPNLPMVMDVLNIAI